MVVPELKVLAATSVKGLLVRRVLVQVTPRLRDMTITPSKNTLPTITQPIDENQAAPKNASDCEPARTENQVESSVRPVGAEVGWEVGVRTGC